MQSALVIAQGEILKPT